MTEPLATRIGSEQTILPGRQLGVIIRDSTRDQGFLFLGNAENEFFAHKSAFQPEGLFYTAQMDEAFSFRVSETSKGLRAWDIRPIATSEEGDAAKIREARTEAERSREEQRAAQRANEVRAAELGDGSRSDGNRRSGDHRPVRRNHGQDR